MYNRNIIMTNCKAESFAHTDDKFVNIPSIPLQTRAGGKLLMKLCWIRQHSQCFSFFDECSNVYGVSESPEYC